MIKPYTKMMDKSNSGILYDKAKQRNPDAKGNNKSRVGFTWCCYCHRLGKHFQNVIKISIRETILLFHSQFTKSFEISESLIPLRTALYDSIIARIGNDPGGQYKKEFMLQLVDIFLIIADQPGAFEELAQNRVLNGVVSKAHIWVQKYYDKEAYVYEDPRLIVISCLLKNGLKNEFQNSDILLKIADFCVFLMKEDIYYRARWPLILRDVSPAVKDAAEKVDSPILQILKALCETCEHFERMPAEIANIRRHH